MKEIILNQKKRGPAPGSIFAKFPKTYAEYAASYECTPRTIKSWVRIGKQKGDLPPLDDSVAMGLWIARYLPGKLAGSVRSPPRQSPDVPPAGHRAASQDRQSSPPPINNEPPRDFSNVRGLSIAENVEQLRRSLAIALELRDEALKGRDENLLAFRQKNYKETFELLRKAEDTLAKLREQSGDLIDKQIVRAEILQALELLRLMRETMPRRIMTELERIMPRPLQRVFRLLEKSLVAAIEKARGDEENVFRNTETLGGLKAAEEMMLA